MTMFAITAYLVIAIGHYGKLVIEGRSDWSFSEFVMYGLLWPLELACWIEQLILERRGR